MADSRILALFVSAFLVACGATTAATPQPSPNSTIANTYNALVKPPNDAGDRLRAASDNPASTITTLGAAAQAFLDSLTKLNSDLVGFEAQVPATDRPDVENLRNTLSSDEAEVQTMIAATSVQQFNVAYAQLTADDIGTAATAVRSDLGLDPGNP